MALVASACGDGTGPDDDRVTLAIQGGDQQFGTPSAEVADPLQVVITDPVTKEPQRNVIVNWQVVAGTGATVTPSQTITDSDGVASTTLRLGSALGIYEVEARTSNQVGQAPRFQARAVQPPAITSAPAIANAGDTITITGSNFSPQGDDNLVLFGGFRGRVVSATTTQLRVVVPACVPARIVSLTAALGAVSGNSVNLEVRGSGLTSLTLERGQVLTISDPAQLGCFRLPGIAGYSVLLIPQNISTVAGTSMPFQLAGLAGGSTVTNVATPLFAHSTSSPAIEFEEKLRARERAMIESANEISARPQASSLADCPPAQLGSRCTFSVINKDDKFVSVTAELKAISDLALIYQDVNAPANGLTPDNFTALGQTFDNPIYSAVTNAFGEPSDLDSNGKVIILLTPIVNAMTPSGTGATSFIAGFFYGCDLVGRSICSGTNSAEMFYTLTADPSGEFGNVRSTQSVMGSIGPVLAHEFQHMINFGKRQNTDALWLSEGMAHHAEDVVADVFETRGDTANARRFRQQNYTRAIRYLRDPTFTSLISESGNGSLELRGGAWLFVKYMVGHRPSVLRDITQSNQFSVTNVVQQMGLPWSTLMANWTVALYADNAPELATANVAPQYTFPNINLRQAMVDAGSYPLRPAVQSFTDFIFRETLPASSAAYLRVTAGANPQPFSLNLAGYLGGAFPTGAAPQLSILRLQ